jgi:hypothetical protein
MPGTMISAWRRSFPKSGDEALQGQRADDNRRVEPMRAVMAVSTQRLCQPAAPPDGLVYSRLWGHCDRPTQAPFSLLFACRRSRKLQQLFVD